MASLVSIVIERFERKQRQQGRLAFGFMRAVDRRFKSSFSFRDDEPSGSALIPAADKLHTFISVAGECRL